MIFFPKRIFDVYNFCLRKATVWIFVCVCECVEERMCAVMWARMLSQGEVLHLEQVLEEFFKTELSRKTPRRVACCSIHICFVGQGFSKISWLREKAMSKACQILNLSDAFWGPVFDSHSPSRTEWSNRLYRLTFSNHRLKPSSSWLPWWTQSNGVERESVPPRPPSPATKATSLSFRVAYPQLTAMLFSGEMSWSPLPQRCQDAHSTSSLTPSPWVASDCWPSGTKFLPLAPESLYLWVSRDGPPSSSCSVSPSMQTLPETTFLLDSSLCLILPNCF